MYIHCIHINVYVSINLETESHNSSGITDVLNLEKSKILLISLVWSFNLCRYRIHQVDGTCLLSSQPHLWVLQGESIQYHTGEILKVSDSQELIIWLSSTSQLRIGCTSQQLLLDFSLQESSLPSHRCRFWCTAQARQRGFLRLWKPLLMNSSLGKQRSIS